MKTLKSIILGLALLVGCSAAKATDTPSPEKLTKNYAINTYIDAVSRGKIAGMNDVIDQNAKFGTLRGSKILSNDKAEMMAFIKANQDVEQTCTVSTTEVETNADICLVRVDMKFEGFVRTNYVTMANTAAGWKITNVYSVFK